MPWGDWQFWVVSLLTLVCLYPLYRLIRPRHRGRKRGTLTISARRHAGGTDDPR